MTGSSRAPGCLRERLLLGDRLLHALVLVLAVRGSCAACRAGARGCWAGVPRRAALVLLCAGLLLRAGFLLRGGQLFDWACLNLLDQAHERSCRVASPGFMAIRSGRVNPLRDTSRFPASPRHDHSDP